MGAVAALGCLGDSIVLEFVEGKLHGDAETQVHEHIAGCEACRKVVAETAKYYLDKAETRETMADSPASISRRDAPAVATGQTVGRYVIVAQRGSGGMGVVHEAYDPQLRRKIALKLLREADDDMRARDDTRQLRLLREAQAMARLSHANVVSVFDAGTHGDEVFIAMELVDGVTLAQWLRERQRSRDEIIDVFVAAARGLAAAHAADLVHRDFKPHNVLVGADGKIKVTDFGLARPTTSLEDTPPGIKATSAPLDAQLTRTGTLVGTPAYMAPEQFAGAPTDAATDQFAFCVALYEALYGERPFSGSSLDVLARAVRSGLVQAPPAGSTVPAGLRDVILRGLRVVPRERYASMDELIAALEAARRVPAPAPRSPRPWLVRGVLAAAGVAALVVAVIVARPAATGEAAKTTPANEAPVAAPRHAPVASPSAAPSPAAVPAPVAPTATPSATPSVSGAVKPTPKPAQKPATAKRPPRTTTTTTTTKTKPTPSDDDALRPLDEGR